MDTTVYGDNIANLHAAMPVLDAVHNTTELNTRMVERYPDRRAAALLDISWVYLYGGR